MHVPCAACGSSDAAYLYPDGHTHCHKCGAHSRVGSGGVPSVVRSVERAGMIDVDVRAIEKRGITQETAEKWGYGYGTYKGQKVHVAQYRDQAGNLVGQKLRFPNKDFLVLGTLKPAGLYGQHLWRDGGRMVVVTEGEIDALTVSQLQNNRWPVVSLPNGASAAAKAFSAATEFLEGFDRVVIMFDNDDVGRAAAVEAAAVLSPGKAYIATLPLKDANDMLQAGRGPEVVDAIWGAKVYRPDGLVTGDEVWDHVTREDLSKSIDFPHSGLNGRTRGFRPGEVILVTAGTGTGKSTWCREMAASCVDQGLKVAYVALEESVRTAALGFLTIALNRPMHFATREEITTAEVHAAFEKTKDRIVYYDHFGSIDAPNLLKRLRYMIKGEGAEVVFLDHISIVVSGMDANQDERRAIDALMTNLASLAQETKATIVVVSHLKRPADGRPHEEGRKVTLADLRGSGSIAQLSWTVIALERDQQSEDDSGKVSTVRVLKCRHTGSTGACGFVKYHPETGRLQEYTPEFDEMPTADEDLE